MRRMTAVLAAVGALLLVYASGVLAQPETPTQKIPDRYIVVFEDGVQRPAALASEHARAYGLQVRFVYTSAIEGYAAVFPNDRALQRVQSDPRVDYVEQDQEVRAVEQTLPWGIDRIDAEVSSTLAGNGSGAVTDVNAYIIDTGIYKHADLNVVGHVNFRGDGQNTDCNGHGTHVAGTVAAMDNSQDVVGVAPGAPLTGVKVLGCSGSGSTAGVIKGVDWVTANANVKGPDGTLGTADDNPNPDIANMSLGGGASTTLDTAVRNSAASGVFYSIAAGNDGQVACNYSPARAGFAATDTNGDGKVNHDDSNGIVTTAATDKSENDPPWSNYGRCVDIWAPGVSILSTKKGGGVTTMSGTSMAAPHVGGGGALYLSSKPLDKPVDVEKSLKADAKTFGTISNAGGTREITREDVGGF
jgi:subtilisin family serine protease